MAPDWIKWIPELDLVHETTLREQCAAVFTDACGQGGWRPEDLDAIPMTLGYPGAPSLRTHIRAVARLAHQTFAVFRELHADSRLLPDYSLLLAGALLHDVGKLLEYTRTPEGEFTFSKQGLLIRHPFSGAMLAAANGLPDAVTHIIAVHAREGEGSPRSVEAQIVNKADLLHFESVRDLLAASSA